MPLRLLSASEARSTVLKRTPLDHSEAEPVVDQIIHDVRSRGDAALWELTERLERGKPTTLEVSPAERQAALAAIPKDLRAALELAADRVRAYHQRQMPTSVLNQDGTGTLVNPIDRVGLMVPGGRADYPSTVIHMAVPARVAGCREVVMCSPPGVDGLPPKTTLAAAEIAGVDRVFALGGAQAVAAMAFGTESVPKVDKVLGPGNVFVAAAKRRLFGIVGIDQIAGPTETVIISDDSADPASVAADLLAQAEHDPSATAIAIVTSRATAEAISAEVDRQLRAFDRASIAASSLADNGAAIVVGSVDEALDLANEFAPEHLALMTRDPWSLVPKVRNAGGLFVGESSLEAIGDYNAGPSHVMPTGGTARFSSPLTVYDFLKLTSVFAVPRADVERLGPAAARLARAEGLNGHAAAIDQRLAVRTR